MIFEVHCGGEDYEVELKPSGEILTDYPMEEEAVLIEMGYDASECYSRFTMLANWPVQFLLRHVAQSNTLRALLGLDFAEYVIPVFAALYPDELTDQLEEAIEIGREKVVSGAYFQPLMSAQDRLRKIERVDAREYEYPGEPSRHTSMMSLIGRKVGNGATMSAVQALLAVHRTVMASGVESILAGVFGASNYARIDTATLPLWSEHTTLWQVKRIYQVMKADLGEEPYPEMTFPSVMPWEMGELGR